MSMFKSLSTVICAVAVLFLSTGVTNAVVAPSNDNCSNAMAIEEVENLAFNTTNATFDGPGLKMTSPNIWYRYTATCTGNVTISLCGSQYDTKIAVYSGGTCNPTLGRLLAYNDDSCDFQSEVVISATAGSTYLIEVGGYDSYKGAGVLTIKCPVQPCKPVNDNYANALVIGNVTNLAFNTSCATLDGQSLCKPGNAGPNIWYLYTATCTGQATVSLCGSSFDTILAVYDGSTPLQSNILKCNDDYCNKQSQVTLNITAGKQLLIEVGGFDPTQKGQGLLTVSCAPKIPDPNDLGDAPDSTNNLGYTMTAYTSPKAVVAHFPTVFKDGTGVAPYGPIHHKPKDIAYLGETVTYENEADKGPDQDSVNNITPATNISNQDGGDDGVIFPISMPSGQWTTFKYKVNVIEPGTDLWVNVWFDFNRDGDWNDDSTTDPNLTCTNGKISEWAVQNQFLFNLPAGLNEITTPAFLSWKAEGKPDDIWMRITLSEIPWKGGSGAGGSGPQSGFMFGETEDYYFSPDTRCFKCEDLDHDGLINSNDLLVLMEQWLDNCQ
jgi:hypothetical protein